MAYTQILYHLAFSTKNHRRVPDPMGIPKLLSYWKGILRNHQCISFGIHAHFLFSLHSTVCLADLVKAIKVGINHWIGIPCSFLSLRGGRNITAFTPAKRDRNRVVQYTRKQQEYHRTLDSLNECKNMPTRAGIEWEDRYLVRVFHLCLGRGFNPSRGWPSFECFLYRVGALVARGRLSQNRTCAVHIRLFRKMGCEPDHRPIYDLEYPNGSTIWVWTTM